MKHIKNLNIENFRGFKSLKIDELNDINIFIGKNNCGKTSLLEAVFLLVGISNPKLSYNIHSFRGEDGIEASQLQYLFHNLDISVSPLLKCKSSDDIVRELEIKPKFQDDELSVEDIKISSESTVSNNIIGVQNHFNIQEENDSSEYDSDFELRDGLGTQVTDKQYSERLNGVFVSSAIKNSDALKRVENLAINQKDHLLLDILKKIDPQLTAIKPMSSGIFLGYKNMKQLVPLAIAGDGIKTIVNIISAITSGTNPVILIDEIENGLHYSAYIELWKAIITLAKEHNAQLFITSHNEEMLEYLVEILEDEEYQGEQDTVSVFNLVNIPQKGNFVYKYSFEGLQSAIETETEIR